MIMRSPIRGSIVAVLTAVLTLSSLDLGPTRAAASGRPQVQADTEDLSARRRHYRGNNRAALRMFGAVAGTIVGIAAAEQARRNWRRHGYYGYYGYYGYHGGYGYPPPPVYHGYGPYYPY
jgi:hypothetical protein